ncbi:HAMP domain-containing histidine kinase [Lutibacter sp. A80]|uniref:sensor histidine kinase n=1 Tax=Lutibacter sp. A80 TaxID=2918453 RepID=UPI001F066019|nr:HAMP domain-containing sensor histidine kinase [Lutibacter sp. A80]UMB62025.1 HAMP domain-containing histidine kinase [Lutibacter sp. A80]
MILVTKTNKYYLIFFVFLFPLMLGADYYLIQHTVNEEVDEILKDEGGRIDFFIKEEGKLPSSNYLFNTTIVNKDFSAPNIYKDTLIYEAYKNKLIPYRTYKFTTVVDDQKMRISLKHIILEMNELIIWLFVTTTLITLLLVAGVFFINQEIYKWTWKPFFENLPKLTNYDVNKQNPVNLKVSNINELEEVNKLVVTLMNQVKKDFQKLKEFNENISHEIQTPLAIIRNKMVLLLESQKLNEKEFKWVQAVYQEANKLSKIGKSLTLISRIENQEFTRLDSVDIGVVVNNIIGNMEEIIKFKNLKLTVDFTPVKVKCDLVLANILFTNLIKNAIQHNHEGGYIKMLLDEEKFEIVNSGAASKIATEKLFNRFQRGNEGTESLGLGLAINQKICEMYGFHLVYNRYKSEHKLTLFFYNEISDEEKE